jgi:hypothetical protein
MSGAELPFEVFDPEIFQVEGLRVTGFWTLGFSEIDMSGSWVKVADGGPLSSLRAETLVEKGSAKSEPRNPHETGIHTVPKSM